MGYPINKNSIEFTTLRIDSLCMVFVTERHPDFSKLRLCSRSQLILIAYLACLVFAICAVWSLDTQAKILICAQSPE